MLLLLPVVSCNNVPKYKLEVLEFKNRLEQSAEALLIDVRKPEEFSYGHIKNAMNINWHDDGFFEMVSRLDKSKPVFIYCLTGGRADPAADNMRKMGFSNVYELKGGFLKWQKAGLPVEGRLAGPGMKRTYYDSMLSTHKTVLVNFGARGCKPCHALLPIVEEINAEKAGKIFVLSVDVDKDGELAREIGIDMIPTIKVFNNGKQSWANSGVISKEEILKHLQ